MVPSSPEILFQVDDDGRAVRWTVIFYTADPKLKRVLFCKEPFTRTSHWQRCRCAGKLPVFVDAPRQGADSYAIDRNFNYPADAP